MSLDQCPLRSSKLNPMASRAFSSPSNNLQSLSRGSQLKQCQKKIPFLIWYSNSNRSNGVINNNRRWLQQISLLKFLYLNLMLHSQEVSRCHPRWETLIRHRQWRLKIQTCRPHSSSNWYKCSRWWLTWWLTQILNIIRRSRWPCFSRCSRWYPWCQRWWSQSNPSSSRPSSIRPRRRRTLKTTCSKTSSRLQLSHTHHPTLLTHRKAPTTCMQLRGHPQSATNSSSSRPTILSEAHRPQVPRCQARITHSSSNSNRITRLTCLID